MINLTMNSLSSTTSSSSISKLSLLLGALCLPSVSAFGRVSLAPSSRAASFATAQHALIYGWDNGDEEDDHKPSYFASDGSSEATSMFGGACSATGVAMAESLSVDPDRVGSLARLAVAFSPPERALSLKDIEKVDVLCVGPTHIDLQAILCESSGCLTLAVPVQFPKACTTTGPFESCVQQNIEQLDQQVTVQLETATGSSTSPPTSLSHAPVLPTNTNNLQYPSWWIAPNTPELIKECQYVSGILNEDEFQTDIRALSQEALKQQQPGLSVRHSKVVALGPAGIAFGVQTDDGQALHITYPYPGGPQRSVSDLRSAVLGCVATAEG